ncbi:uncharacterized protein PFL1_06179 [Pseudozyma flocculosa PF-1]|uniref:Uncharacterized protein n=1 Tax=Pseudozyma flocculosa PF-1 TaxID=1277687 RepID=A0A061H237_9BASI|nr:uncharacterized protein PFL1_06179 [Pseudozyma flocculosa PF-1]EPQ26244.1 hypothetical protein PFL1_06179 [Pseudozyma flocculosa PF-1]
MPCRHCERRAIDCEYAPAKPKPKTKAQHPQLSPVTDVNTRAGSDPQLASIRDAGNGAHGQVPSRMSAMEPPRQSRRPSDENMILPVAGNKRKFLEGLDVASAVLQQHRGFGKRLRDGDGNGEDDDDRRWAPFPASRDEASRMPSSASSHASDLAMIQNDNTAVPVQPIISYPETWWDHTVAVIGGSRPFATKLIQLLLRRFVQSNAIFFGLLHAPTLLRNVSTQEGIRSADPALYLSVLAVAACDMHRTQLVEPITADLRAADAASRKLSMQLIKMARQYIDSALLDEAGVSPSTGQAASILALLQEDGSSEQVALVGIAENIVRSSRIHETVSSREPGVQMCEPDSELYWRRPLASGSSEAEIKYESIVRLCWTGVSHRCRKLIAMPDLDVQAERWPDFLESVRPMAFWEPSILPPDLPPTFFHSQNLMRCSAEVARVCVALASTVSTLQSDLEGRPGTAAPDAVHELLRRLDKLESAFVRHRPTDAAEMHSILGRTCQMFCRMHVWARISIWRKHRLWTKVDEWSDPLATADVPLSRQLPPTVNYWIVLFDEMVCGLSKDLDSFVVAGTLPQTSAAEIDSVIRHCIVALDLVDASQAPYDFLRAFDRAAAVLKRVMSVSKFNPHFPQLDDAMEGRFVAAQARREHKRFLQGAAGEEGPPGSILNRVWTVPPPMPDPKAHELRRNTCPSSSSASSISAAGSTSTPDSNTVSVQSLEEETISAASRNNVSGPHVLSNG